MTRRTTALPESIPISTSTSRTSRTRVLVTVAFVVTTTLLGSTIAVADEPRASCTEGDEETKTVCRLRLRFADDPKAQERVLALHAKTGDDVDVTEAFLMDGGYRGKISIVPAWPKGAARKHFEWVAAAREKHVAFVEAVRKRAKETAAAMAPGTAASDASAPAADPVRYRANGMALRFFRSVKARTPSAYASGWTLAYNLEGSLNTSADAVDETFFHELFHANDDDHGNFSLKVLGPIHDRIRRKCNADSACLAPYAPNGTMVRGGTYYAFQPGNDAREYGAELAVRYYREMRTALDGKPVPRPFKCGGPPENREVWDAFVNEFFGGVDAVTCPTPR